MHILLNEIFLQDHFKSGYSKPYNPTVNDLQAEDWVVYYN